MRVLEQRRRAHGYRRIDSIEEGEEVSDESIGQLRLQEVFQYLIIRSITQSDGPQVVLIHELIEIIGTEHHRLGNHDLGVLILVEFWMTLDDIVEESQTSTLASQRAFTDTGEVGIAVELQTVEDGDNTDILHPTILHDRIEDNLTVHIHILQLMPGDMLQERRHREDGTCRQPTAHVVARDMIAQRVGRNLEDIVLQLLQRGDTGNLFLRNRVTEDEIAKAHVFLDELTQVDIHLLRVLVNEMELLRLSLLTVLRLRALENQWHILVVAANLMKQFQTSLSITILHMTQSTVGGLHRETGIADDTQHIITITVIPLHRLLVVGGQHHLRTTTFTLGGSMGVQRLGREVLRLCQNIIIEVREHGRIETDIILYEQDHLHACLTDIVLNIHLVLNQFDDGEDQVRIAQPTEHVIEDSHILVLDTFGDTMRERGEHHTRNLWSHLLHLTSYLKGVVVSITWHTDHQVDVV